MFCQITPSSLPLVHTVITSRNSRALSPEIGRGGNGDLVEKGTGKTGHLNLSLPEKALRTTIASVSGGRVPMGATG